MALVNLGRVCLAAGDLEAAMKHSEKALASGLFEGVALRTMGMMFL
jgi:hypothetical protein